MTGEQQLLDHLKDEAIAYEYHAHPAAFTCGDVAALGLNIDGADTKNLFLTDRGSRFFLLATTHDKRVDLKAFARLHGLPKLSFGSPEHLKEFLGVEPGSVTILGVFHDTAHKVALIVDEDVWAHPRIQCHPLVNTATVVIARDDLHRFLNQTGHAPLILHVPGRES